VTGELELRPVGRVVSALVDPATAPKQGDEGALDADLVFDPAMWPALADIGVGDELLVLTWLDRAQRDVLTVHPRDDERQALRGVFSTRSADRPNPIGLHRVEVLAIGRAADRVSLKVSNLEAVDGTPVIDVKPVLGPMSER
jgi:tRNA-Thr(GGU) m(6)t(6)A37 methyltransferase TsaA